MKHFLFVFCLALFAPLKAQVSIQNNTPYNSNQYLIENVLLGVGVSVSNVSFNGDPLQIGFFDNGNSSIGIDSGIVLCTDQIHSLDLNYTGIITPNFSMNSDPTLLEIANDVPPIIGQNFSLTQVQDVAELEFDFVPSGDTVKFNFVFASDEYLEWVNSSFNDIFAFFISGPGIVGPYPSPVGFPDGAQNIAYVPNYTPDLPITVSSVNNLINDAYYVDNFSNVDVAADGFTTKIQISSPVICGQTYHLKISIADGEDQSLKSAVFLEGGSLKSGNFIASILPEPNPGFVDSVLYEGCNEYEIVFNRAGDLVLSDTLYLIYSGSAQQGVDYANLPDTLIFLPGQDSASIFIQAFEDGLIDAGETLQIKAYIGDTNGCANVKFINLTLQELKPAVLNTPNDTLFCYETTHNTITCEIIEGMAPSIYTWSTGFTDTTGLSSSIEVYPVSSTYYYVTVTDYCGKYAVKDSVYVFVPQTSMQLSAPDAFSYCQDYVVQLNPTVIGSSPEYTYWWQDANGNIGQGLELSVQASQTITLFVTDSCRTDTVSVPVYIELKKVLSQFTTDVQLSCDSIELRLSNQSENALQYQWFYNGSMYSQAKEISLVLPYGASYQLSLVAINDVCRDGQIYTDTLLAFDDYYKLLIPNVFTPNNDNLNEVFSIKDGHLFTECTNYQIFNRWGKKVFESSKDQPIWSGNDHEPGTYFYVVEFRGKEYSGEITLLK